MLHFIVYLVATAFVSAAVAQIQCPDGFSLFEGSCYIIGDAGYNYYEAGDECAKKYSELVTIVSAEENEFIKSLLKDDYANGAWIGLALADVGNGLWVNTYTRAKESFKDFVDSSTGPPKGLTGNEDYFTDLECAALSNKDDWRWVGKNCSVRDGMKFVCKSSPLQQTCTSRACFRLLEKPEAHYTGKTKCGHLGGIRARIRSKDENNVMIDFINQASVYLANFRLFGGRGVWIGGSDEGTEGDWYWDTPGQKDKISDGFVNWEDDEPDNKGFGRRGENCMILSVPGGKWKDVTCLGHRPTLCEIPNENAITG